MKLLTPVLIALLLTACGRSSPVAKTPVDPPPNSVGDAAGSGAESARRAALPAPTDGLAWHWDESAETAGFGVSAQNSSLTIACHEGKIVISRYDAAPHAGRATMSFTGNGNVASLPAETVGEPSTLSSYWRGSEPPSDRTAAVARVFDGPGPVEIALAGTTTLVAAPSTLPARAFAACRR